MSMLMMVKVGDSNGSNRGIQLSKPELKDTSNRTNAPVDDPMTSLSSCLLIMDDNHWLVEWLAYHWTVLNLRYMIIAIDERSKTSPVPVLDRWKGRIEYELWNDSHFFQIPDSAETLQEINLARQHSFLPKCMQVFKERKHAWTLFTDTDEFVVINRRARKVKHELYRPDVPPLDRPGSVMTFLNQEKARRGTKCFSMGRLQFGPDEAPVKSVQRDVPSFLNASDFLTFRWMNAADDLVGPKNIVDLSAVDRKLIPRKTCHQHRVIEEVCAEAGHTWNRKNSLLQVYHYLGTLEQFSFRDDARNTLKTAGRNRRFNRYRGVIIETADDLRPWIKAFIEKVGQDEALRLLEGAGRTRGWPPAKIHSSLFAPPLRVNEKQFGKDEAEINSNSMVFSEARTDRSGASMADMLIAHAYAYANGLEYGGACSTDHLPHQQSTQDLINTVGLQNILRFACPRDGVSTESMLERSVYAKDGTAWFSPSYLNFLRARVKYPPQQLDDKVDHVVVHIRRGDVSPCSYYANRYLPNSHFLAILKKYVPPGLPVTIFSESTSFESWDDFSNYSVRLDTDLREAWMAMLTAKFIVLSKSSFSMLPAILNNRNATVIYTPFMHHKLESWTTVSQKIMEKTKSRLKELINKRCSEKDKKVALRKLG